MPYSFKNPFADGRIWSPSHGTIDLSFIGDNKIPYVDSVGIKIGTAMDFELTVNLSPTYKAAVDLIDNQPWIRLGNTLGVRWGYNDGQPSHMSGWIYGFMQVPEVNMGDEISIVIKANGIGNNLSTNESTRVWPLQSLTDIFQVMADKYGVKLVWQNVEGGQKEYFDRKLSYTQAGLTDYQFIERYARQCSTGTENTPVASVFVGNELRLIGSPNKKTVPVAEFHMYGKPDPANNIFPMNGFSPENYGALFLPSRTFSTVLTGPNTDPAKDVVKVDSVGNKDEGESSGKENNVSGEETNYTAGEEVDPNPDSGMKHDAKQDVLMEAGKHVPVIIDAQKEKESAQSIIDNFRQQQAGQYGINVSFNTLALPNLVPMQYVRLRGVTAFFSTDYQVKELDITIGDGGAEMDITAWAIGLPEGMSAFAKAVNSSEQGETDPGEGTEEVEADSSASE